jgi:hypothetical protein
MIRKFLREICATVRSHFEAFDMKPTLPMNTTPANTRPRWMTYLKATAFLTPPMLVWALSCVFVFPKLKQLWADLGTVDPALFSFMRTSEFMMRNGLLIAMMTMARFVFLEWRNERWWPRLRSVSVGTLVFVVNSAVLVLLLAMLASAIVVAASFAPPR